MLNATEIKELISKIKEEINGCCHNNYRRRIGLDLLESRLGEGVLMQSKRRDHDFSPLKP